jgi:hypothetical protein
MNKQCQLSTSPGRSWRIATMPNLSDQMAALMNLADDSLIAFPSAICAGISVLQWIMFMSMTGFIVTE